MKENTAAKFVTYENTYAPGQVVTIPRLLSSYVPGSAAHIIGREAELQAISKHLAEQQPTVLVNGIGGIGKTSVATKYFTVHGQAYKHLGWLTVQSSLRETFINSHVLLRALRIEQEVQELVKGLQIQQAFELVLSQLGLLEPTLIVLDNANNLTDLIEHQAAFHHARCHFLITSRALPQEWAVVPVTSLPEHEAIALFTKLAPDVSATKVELQDLLAKLFYHTLLIELVAKSLAQNGFTFPELQAMIQEQFIHHEALNEDILPTGPHGLSVSDHQKRGRIEDYLWRIFRQVKALNEDLQQVLRAIALLPLATTYERDELKTHLEFFEITKVAPKLTHLCELGWLEKEQLPGAKPQYKMHPLIADVVVKHLKVDAEYAAGYIEEVADIIDYDPTDPSHNLFVINESKSLAERLHDLFQHQKTAAVVRLMGCLGYLEENFGFYQMAADYKEQAVAMAKELFEEGHQTIARYQSNLANVYSNLGRYEAAAQQLEMVLESQTKNLGEDHKWIAIYQSNLANVYGDLGRHEEAAQLLETALENDLKNFGPAHPTIAISQSNLANVYRDLGRHEEALQLLETALENDLKNFGPAHPKIATRQSNLANVYGDLGRHEEAAQLLETALENDLKNFGPAHPKIATRQNNLAHVYHNFGRQEEAQILWQAAYQNYLSNFGKKHPHTIYFKKMAER